MVLAKALDVLDWGMQSVSDYGLPVAAITLSRSNLGSCRISPLLVDVRYWRRSSARKARADASYAAFS